MGLLDLPEDEQIKYLRRIFSGGPSHNAMTLHYLDKFLNGNSSDALQKINDNYTREFFNLVKMGHIEIKINDEAQIILKGVRQIFEEELA